MDSFLRDRLSIVAAVGCGVAVAVSGVSGVINAYNANRTHRYFSHQIELLNTTIEQLKREVEELRFASNLNSPLTHKSICELDSHLIKSKADHQSVSTDDNEEFFDFNDGEQESENIIPMNCQIEDKYSKVQCLMAETDDISLEEWIKEYDIILDDISVDKQQLYDKIKCAQTKYGNCAEILWRQSKATHLLSVAAHKQKDLDLKKKLSFETLEYAKKAIECDQNNADCHKWYAIAIGSISDFIPIKDKIANGHEFKKHVDLALKLKPNDPSIYHMLGRFCLEVSNLTWVERKVASALFNKVPESSYEDSFNNFIMAHQIKPEWKENLLFIAKTFISQKKYRESLEWIKRGLAVKCVGEDDIIAHEELVSLHSKYSKYER